MADDEKHGLTVEFEDNGDTYDKALSYDIQSDFKVDADAWSIEVFGEDPIALRRRFAIGRPCRLYIDDRLQVIGRIGNTSGSGGGSGALQVSGRDYFADLIDPCIDPVVRVNGKMSLRDALLEGLRVFGITEIETSLEKVTSARIGSIQYEQRELPSTFSPQSQSVIDITNALGGVPVSVGDPVPELAPNKNGEGALEWASRLTARSGATCQPGTKRSAIAVVEPDYKSPVRWAFYRYADRARGQNIQDGVARRSGDDVPTWVNVSGRHVSTEQQAKGAFRGFSVSGDDSPSGLKNSAEGKRFIEASKMVGHRIPHGQKNVPPALYKPIYYRDDDAKSREQLERSARRMLADKTSSFFEYEVSLAGHQDPKTGGTYAMNTLASAIDEMEDVSEAALWVQSTTLSFKSGQGRTSTLKLILPGSYIL